MTECWADGELRAYVDRELTVDVEVRLAAHLKRCPECEARYRELAGRSARVMELVGALPEPEWSGLPVCPVARRRGRPWRWAVAAGALAAALAVVGLMPPKRVEEPARTEQPAAPVASAPALGPAPVHARIQPAHARGMRHPRRAAPARAAETDFVALDNEPIDTGVVMRVALGNENVLADVVYSADGRARAIRLVDGKFTY